MNQDKQLEGHIEDLTFKDFKNHTIELIQLIRRKFLVISIISVFGALLGFWFAYIDKPDYSAKTRFLMKDAGNNSSIMNSLGSLGSLIGGAAGVGAALERTLAVISSEKLIGESLLTQVELNNKKDFIINHIIQVQGLRKDWKADTLLNNIYFSQNENELSKMGLAHRKAYKAIINMFSMPSSNYFKKSYDKKSGVFETVINTNNEQLSIELSNVIFNRLDDFLYNQSVNSSGKNVLIINKKIDSIKNELNNIQLSLARNNDRTLGLIMQEDKVDQKKLMMKEQMLTIMYGEAQKNLETFKFVNQSISTGLEIIELPFSPIKPNRRDKVKFSFLGFFSFGLFTIIYFLTKKWLISNKTE